MHSAEHLLNQAMVRIIGCGRCFSAHINPKKSKCDYHFDRLLTDAEVAAVQVEVNRIIDQDLPVTVEEMPGVMAEEVFDVARVPGKDALPSFRVVRMGEYDACPCIGDHVSSTGEIGSFAITSVGFDDAVLRVRFRLI